MHEPVLVTEAVALVNPRPTGVYVDATVGLGGHAAALLEAGAGRVVGIDRDPAALDAARAALARYGDRVDLVHGDYRDLARLLAARGLAQVDGVLADLGVSSLQLDDPARGFSFRGDGPLDMRMDPSTGVPLGERLAGADEGQLADVIRRFGEERHARRIARAIVRARDREPLTGTAHLAAVVRRAAARGRWERIDPATRTFQALRIWVNGELDGLDEFVEAAMAALAGDGRLVVIAFHSLEDRLIKHAFRRLAEAGRARLLTRKPVQPAEAELARNPRSRSARLRALEKAA